MTRSPTEHLRLADPWWLATNGGVLANPFLVCHRLRTCTKRMPPTMSPSPLDTRPRCPGGRRFPL